MATKSTEEEWKNEENYWYQKARETAAALLDRPAFSYDPAGDPIYQTARDQAVRLGRRAMEDTLGRAASLTGGYASSYAQTLGANAYNDQISRLAEKLPDYYDRARKAYDSETGELRDALSTAIGLYDKDYTAWLDRQEALEREAAARTKQDQWEREFAWDKEKWAAQLAAQQAASAESQDRSDRSTNRSYAYRMAMLALQQGLSVSDDLLETAGIDKAYAETIRRYYYNLHH